MFSSHDTSGLRSSGPTLRPLDSTGGNGTDLDASCGRVATDWWSTLSVSSDRIVAGHNDPEA